jgi:hypothetical protein
MGRPSKPMAKNQNSKFTTRNNKQDIFSKLSKGPKLKTQSNKGNTDDIQPEGDKP